MARSYAIVWRPQGGPTSVGRLELSEHSLVFEGAVPNGESTRDTIVRARIRGVTIVRDTAQRLAELPTLVLALAEGGLYQVASVDGPGTLGEIARQIARAREKEPAS